VAGEAGIGKTRLAEELLDWRRAQGDLTLAARCYLGEVISYSPLATWLRAAGLVNQASGGLADLWLTEIARIVPEVLVERPDLPPPAPMRENWQRQRLFEAITRALLTQSRPLTVVLEDFQWCDQATLEWLPFFLRWPAPAPVVLCSTLRTEELQEQPGVTRLLAGLRHDGIVEELTRARMLAERMGDRALQTRAAVYLATLHRMLHQPDLSARSPRRRSRSRSHPQRRCRSMSAQLAAISRGLPCGRVTRSKPSMVRLRSTLGMGCLTRLRSCGSRSGR